MTVLIRDRDEALASANIAIACHHDTIGRVHFRSAPLTSYAAGRFAKLQQAFLKGHLAAPSPILHAALSLVLFEGISTKADLSSALNSLNQMYRWDGCVYLDWLDPVGRQNRRHLSSITQAILALPRPAGIDAQAILQALEKFLQDVVCGPSRTYSLEVFLLDAQAWLYEHLPLPLFSHCIGKAPITALNRSTLARHESAQALLSRMAEQETDSSAFASAIGGYFAANQENHGSWFIDEFVRICRRKRTLSNADDKQRMLSDCKAMTSRVADSSPMSALILAWIIDLLESGTRTKMHLKAITPAKYVGCAAKRLWEAFRGKDIETITHTEFLNIYQAMMDGLSSSQKRTLASALNSWHFFLNCWFGVPPLYRSLHRWVPVIAPKANVVWPHEMEVIRAWLAEPMPDARLQGQLRVAFEIACCVRIRANELLNLRLQNIHCDEASVTIEIATKTVDGGVKTPAGFRRANVESAESVALIKAWCEQRLREGAFPSDYLFGDPYRPDTKYAPGPLYAHLNFSLKAATGDTSLALHALSHTRISMDWFNAAFETPGADINPFERESIVAGHASPATGFTSYFHLFEAWLHSCLDQEIQKHFSAWACIRSWVGKTPDAYRQARSRARRQDPALTKEAFAARLTQASCPVLLLPRASDGIALQEPTNPLVPMPPKPLTLAATIDILNDIAFGHSVKAIALRSNRTPEEIDGLGRIALDVMRDIGEVDRRRGPPTAYQAVLELQVCLQSGRHNNLQFQRVGQAKVGHLYDLIASGRQAEIVDRGIDAWERCYRHGYVSLDPVGAAAPFIAMLDAADFPRSAIVIRGIEPLKRPVMAAFRAGKPGLPHWESIQARPGRPKVYLTLASYAPDQTHGRSIGNAGIGMGGVHALLFAAAVRRRMSSGALQLKN